MLGRRDSSFWNNFDSAAVKGCEWQQKIEILKYVCEKLVIQNGKTNYDEVHEISMCAYRITIGLRIQFREFYKLW